MFFIGWGHGDILMEQQNDSERKGKVNLSVSPKNFSAISTGTIYETLFDFNQARVSLIKVSEFRRK